MELLRHVIVYFTLVLRVGRSLGRSLLLWPRLFCGGVFSCLTRKEEVSSSIRTSSRHSLSASASQSSGIPFCEVTTTPEQVGSNHRISRALRETIEERNECWSSDTHGMYQEKEIDSGSITSATRNESQTDLEAQTYHSITDSFSGAVPCTDLSWYSADPFL